MTHETHIPAAAHFQRLLASLPPWFVADLRMQLDRGAIYHHVLGGISRQLRSIPRKPNTLALLLWLIGQGEACEGGYLRAPKPPDEQIRAELACGKRFPYEEWRDLRGTGLVIDHPDMPRWLRLYGDPADVHQAPELPTLFDDPRACADAAAGPPPNPRARADEPIIMPPHFPPAEPPNPRARADEPQFRSRRHPRTRGPKSARTRG